MCGRWTLIAVGCSEEFLHAALEAQGEYQTEWPTKTAAESALQKVADVVLPGAVLVCELMDSMDIWGAAEEVESE